MHRFAVTRAGTLTEKQDGGTQLRCCNRGRSFNLTMWCSELDFLSILHIGNGHDKRILSGDGWCIGFKALFRATPHRA